MNPLYNEMGNNNVQNNFMSRFNQFRQNFKGNPQEQVQQMLNSGKVSQADYNRAVQLANQLQQMMKFKF